MSVTTTNATAVVRTFTDLDFAFTKHPTKRDVSKKVGTAAVVQALKTLVLMNFYEKPFQPWIGCNARRLLFEPLSPIITSVLRDTILDVITKNESRVKITECTVTADYDDNAYQVYLEFYVNNQTAPVAVSFILERIR